VSRTRTHGGIEKIDVPRPRRLTEILKESG
jgi:hypothetical protein